MASVDQSNEPHDGPTVTAPTAIARGGASRDRRSRLLVGAVVLFVLAGAVVWWQTSRPERRLGPEPTVSGDECGLGHAPAAIVALDGQSGALRWSRLVSGADGFWPSGLAVADGTVAVFGESGDVQALSSSDGAPRWCGTGQVVSSVDDRFFTIRDGKTVEIDPRTGSTEPVASDMLANLLEQAAGPIAVRSDTTGWPRAGLTVTASDRSNDHLLWSQDLAGYALVSTDKVVILNDQTNGTFQVQPSEPGGPRADHFSVTAYELATGKQEWTAEVPRFGGLFVAGNRVFVKGWTDDTIRALDADTGELLWAVEQDNPGRTTRYSEPGELTAVAEDPRTGDVFALLVSSPPYRD